MPLQNRWKALIDGWRTSSVERKIQIVAPLAVAITGGLVLIALDVEPEDQPRPALLEVVDLAVGGGGIDPHDLPFLDLLVRTTDATGSVITRAELEVRTQAVIEICEGGGAPLESTTEHDLVMPQESPGAGRVVEAELSQQIEPDEADRFSIRMTLPDAEFFWDPHLYQVNVRLFHDGSNVPVDAGPAILSVPIVPTWQYFMPEVSGALEQTILDCYQENARVLQRFLGLDGVKAPSLTSDLLDPPEESPAPTAASSPSDLPRASTAAVAKPPLASTTQDFLAYVSGSGLSCETGDFGLACDSGDYHVTVFNWETVSTWEGDPAAVGIVMALSSHSSESVPLIFEGLALLATADPDASSWVYATKLAPTRDARQTFDGVEIRLSRLLKGTWSMFIDRP